ncbi:DUF2786 domain-containing protein [Vaginisenegalia massiliensis]|uniref:DUF2786 domain-containing protein n=1 Tax=Vaginisenegalia massiliensis TaxID=2058294 RepID=UPI000F52A3A1|nr:DUF2786 domain-containing protein [Vaginisenegalia massiliensis]
MTESINEKILDKIRNLLSLAEDGGNDEESQTALLMAQKLMLKYKISQHELTDQNHDEIILKSLSYYKRLYWWEKELVRIIADNFRVMFYIQSNRLPYQASVQRKIVLMGFPEDVELAYEIFYLTSQAMKHYAKVHLAGLDESAQELKELRKSYYQGFMDGLSAKFEQQRQEMMRENQAYALVIQTPQKVKDAFQEQVNGSITFKQPVPSKNNLAYQQGYTQGTNLSLNNKRLEQRTNKESL